MGWALETYRLDNIYFIFVPTEAYDTISDSSLWKGL